MKLFTAQIMADLQANHAAQMQCGTLDPLPVVKIFTPDANATWLFTEIDEDGRLFGLCDLGMGMPELGYVSRDELESLTGKLGLPVERDEWFTARAPLSAYADYAMSRGSITSAEINVRAPERAQGVEHA